jgi:hypothetical protein
VAVALLASLAFVVTISDILRDVGCADGRGFLNSTSE